MSTFSAIDLATVPAPNVVESLDFETVLAAMLADLQARDPAFTALVESDPAYKILEVAAYREVLIRQRVNDASRAVMLAYATGADLDNLAAFYSVTRLVIDPGDPNGIPPVPPTYESDTDFRRRVTLAVEGFSTAGPRGAYIFHGLKVTGVKDVSVMGPNDDEEIEPGEVVVTVLALDPENGVPSGGLLTAVEAALNADDVRPLTDSVTVQAATVVNYAIEATLEVLPGPDTAVVLADAQARIAAYVAAQHRLGSGASLSGIYGALHAPGVSKVNLVSPVADVAATDYEAAFCTDIDVTLA